MLVFEVVVDFLSKFSRFLSKVCYTHLGNSDAKMLDWWILDAIAGLDSCHANSGLSRRHQGASFLKVLEASCTDDPESKFQNPEELLQHPEFKHRNLCANLICKVPGAGYLFEEDLQTPVL